MVRSVLRLQFMVLCFVAVLLLTCSSQHDRVQLQLDSIPLKSTFESEELLARALVQALRDSSAFALSQLQVSYDEYQNVIWAAIPPQETAGVPVETAWNWVTRDSEKGIRRALFDHGGKDLVFIRCYVQRETKSYGNLRIHRGFRVVMEDRSIPEILDVNLPNLLAEYGGHFKVIAYEED